MDAARAARLAKRGATLAVKYGPQAKLAWDNGGRKAADAAAARVTLARHRRHAFAEADTLKDGSVLRVAPGGVAAYVVFAGDEPVSVHPPAAPDGPALADLVAHADLDKRVTPDEQRAARAARRERLRPRRPGSGARTDPKALPPPE
ncbi:hypothetical protein [Nocardioides sp. CFH 31398]|uniref:hypothetical protein n=1 Tax=Nocardioides sp. CFH 31398 TaxID=2919579 RepID=UPI001F068109|nr:hypothetical protein [Nocardioides sp. CFH 31398]MCH1867618.1 hypothetical protein [Nocardioides sp. CFH 31398]